MSLQQCKKCKFTKHISTYTTLDCPVGNGEHEFEFFESPLLNVPKLTDEDLERIRVENEKHYGPGKGDQIERRLIALENRVKTLEKDNDARGMSGMRIG